MPRRMGLRLAIRRPWIKSVGSPEPTEMIMREMRAAEAAATRRRKTSIKLRWPLWNLRPERNENHWDNQTVEANLNVAIDQPPALESYMPRREG